MISVSRVGPDQYDARTSGSVASEEPVSEAVRRIAAESEAADRRAPLNEAALLGLRRRGLSGAALWVAREESGRVSGFALASADPDAAPSPGVSASTGGPGGAGGGRGDRAVEVDLVVAPSARRHGVARALAEKVLDAVGGAEVTAWSHGNHPAAARLAADLGFERARDLWVMRRPLSEDHPLPEITPIAGIVVRPFGPGQDEDAFLAVNAEAFVDHPEQGQMTRADLEARMAEPWFDPAGFLLADDERAPAGSDDAVESPSLLGFHWTKVHHDQDPPVGEVYVVGISPVAQGRGLGKLLTLAGLHHLRDRGLGEVILYVEGDNPAAIAVYSGLGFVHADADTDVQYARRSG